MGSHSNSSFLPSTLVLMIGVSLPNRLQTNQHQISQLNCDINPNTPTGFNYNLFINEDKNSLVQFGLIGDMNNILRENASDLRQSETNASFGLGFTVNKNLFQPLILVNGIWIEKPRDNETKISAKNPQFAFFISDTSSPSGNAIYLSERKSGNILLSDFYAKVYEQIGFPFCLYGLAEFSTLNASSLHENLEEDFSEKHNEYGFLFGCAANFSQLHDKKLRRKLRKIFKFSGEFFESHSRFLSLRRCLQNPKEIDVSSALDVFHVLPSSILSFINASVFVISDADQINQLDLKFRVESQIYNSSVHSIHFYYSMLSTISLQIILLAVSCSVQAIIF